MTVKVEPASDLENALREVTERGEPVPLEQSGQTVGYVISPRLLKTLNDMIEELEDRLDAEAYAEAKREIAARGEDFIPLEEICKELGLE